jgi:hypothetical protein
LAARHRQRHRRDVVFSAAATVRVEASTTASNAAASPVTDRLTTVAVAGHLAQDGGLEAE